MPSKSTRKRKPVRRTTKSLRKSRFPGPPRVGPAFDRLVAVMNRLRSPNGCPWDREQTHATLRTYLIEEAYEVLDAMESSDDAKFAEELGDLLLQVLFHAQIAREESRFSIAEVIGEIYEKMIRRHPHVFGEKRAKDAAEVLRNWEIIKAEERKRKGVRKEIKEVNDAAPGGSSESFTSSTSSPSILDGVPHTLPALLEALQLTRKAARIGFDWNSLDGIFDKLDEETHELRTVLASPVAQGGAAPARRSLREGGSPGAVPGGRNFSSDNGAVPNQGASAPEGAAPSSSIEGEVGDILFVAVNLARFLDVDPEIALKKTSAKFCRRFREMERIARAQGTTLAQVPRPEMESLWDQAKLREQQS